MRIELVLENCGSFIVVSAAYKRYRAEVECNYREQVKEKMMEQMIEQMLEQVMEYSLADDIWKTGSDMVMQRLDTAEEEVVYLAVVQEC